MCGSSSREHTTEHTPNDERTSPGTAGELRAEFAFPDPTRPDHTRTTPNSPSIPTSSTSTREPRLDVDGVEEIDLGGCAWTLYVAQRELDSIPFTAPEVFVARTRELVPMAVALLEESRRRRARPFDVSAPAVPVVPSGGK